MYYVECSLVNQELSFHQDRVTPRCLGKIIGDSYVQCDASSIRPCKNVRNSSSGTL